MKARYVSVALTCALGGALLFAGPPALAVSPPNPPSPGGGTSGSTGDAYAIKLSLTSSGLNYQSADGTAITATSDTTTDGLRTIEATRSNGSPIEIVEYFAPPITPGTDGLQADNNDSADPSQYTANADVNSDAGVSSDQTYTDASTVATPSAFKPTFATAITPSTVAIAWPIVNGAPTHPTGVTRDGTTIPADSQTSVSDTGLTPGTAYDYVAQGNDASGNSVTRDIPVNTLNLPGGGGGGSIAALQSTGFMHKAFIPDNLVSMDGAVATGCGKFGQSGYQFKGDNRSWAMPTSADPSTSTGFRTLMYAKVTWNSGTASLSTTRRVQPTKVYHNGSLSESRTASSSHMLFQEIQRGHSYAQVRFNHKAGNPFCITGAITYTEMVRFYRNGTLEVVGSRYPVPRHEGYGRWDRVGTDPAWHTVFRLENQGFGCLTGACGRQNINSSRQY